ncbi:glutathione S-transferase kappa 1-like [Sycon ciliatum]|uniref:glutathione S-transferase kappa 1-like n=1 Tax=Sycon ciliatum TaxID=27933 RepID=UPI0020AEAABC|eukprot:scpid86467/ scgid12692/ Glutathione S-transferase kappa 1; GST 13-13; GST class-kappa; GSTK1-1; Glutathione S-transferase subunit 13
MAAQRMAVNLYYDITSPYSWLAFEVLCRYRDLWQMDLKLQPVFLSGIRNITGNQLKNVPPQRANYVVKDLKRLAELMDVPLVMKSECWQYTMTQGTLPVQRFLTAMAQHCPEHLEHVSRQLWVRLWSKGKEVHEEETFHEVCAKAGMSTGTAEELCRLAQTPEIKDKLKAATQEAVDVGAYGLPVFTIQLSKFSKPQMFFGSDRLELMAFLAGKPWLGPRPQQPRSRL